MRERESPCLRANLPARARISLLARGFPLLSHKTGRVRSDIRCSCAERVCALKTCLLCACSNFVLCTRTSLRALALDINYFHTWIKCQKLCEEGTDPGISLQFNNI